MMRFLYYLSQAFLNTFQITKVFLKMRYLNMIQFSRDSPTTEKCDVVFLGPNRHAV